MCVPTSVVFARWIRATAGTKAAISATIWRKRDHATRAITPPGRGGETGRRTGLKILGCASSVRVRSPPPALKCQVLFGLDFDGVSPSQRIWRTPEYRLTLSRCRRHLHVSRRQEPPLSGVCGLWHRDGPERFAGCAARGHFRAAARSSAAARWADKSLL